MLYDGNDIFATRNRQFAAHKANRWNVCCRFPKPLTEIGTFSAFLEAISALLIHHTVYHSTNAPLLITSADV